jgi:hypothetical protein
MRIVIPARRAGALGGFYSVGFAVYPEADESVRVAWHREHSATWEPGLVTWDEPTGETVTWWTHDPPARRTKK